MKEYGPDIPHLTLRHAVLAFAASLLPQSRFSEQSEHQINEATTALRRQVSSPTNVCEADFFAAGMMMWVLWIKNRPKNALTHAAGAMTMFLNFLSKSNEAPLSDMLTVYGPLVYGEARFYGALGLDSQFSPGLFQKRTTFKERVKYQLELIYCGSLTVPWLTSGCQALIDAMWDLEWLLLSYLSAITSGAEHATEQLPAAMKHVMDEYNDPDLQHAMAGLERLQEADRARLTDVEEEVMEYLRLKKLSIDLLIVVLSTPSVLDGLVSLDAYSIAHEQTALGMSQRLQRVGQAHLFYTWAYVIDLGLAGLSLSVYGHGKGVSNVGMFADVKNVVG